MELFNKYVPQIGDVVDFIDTCRKPNVRACGTIDEVPSGDLLAVWVRDLVSLEDGSHLDSRSYAFGSEIWRAKRGEQVWGALDS